MKRDELKEIVEWHSLKNTVSPAAIMVAVDMYVKSLESTPPEGKGYSEAQMVDCFISGNNHPAAENESEQRIWAHNFIASLPSPPVKDDWVSVEDDKPTPFTPVLVCFSKESPGMNNIIKTGRWVGDTFHIDGSLPLLPTFVTHWQPLPHPPKDKTHQSKTK